MKKHKNKFIAAAVILAVLVVAWFWGGVSTVNVPSSDPLVIAAATIDADYHSPSIIAEEELAEPLAPSNPVDIQEISDTSIEGEADDSVEHALPNAVYDNYATPEYSPSEPNEVTYQNNEISYHDYDNAQSEPDVPDINESEDSIFDIVPEVASQDSFAATPEGVVVPHVAQGNTQIFAADHPEMRVPVEPEDMVIGDGSFTVILSVRVHTILYNMHLLHRDKHELVPVDGWIFPPTEVIAFEGESVFNVLQREMRRNRIHMVSRWTPIFNSAYVEAINNLYEFDVGPLSGWMYSVNGWFPNFGASRYLLSEGDVIEWIFTVDLGRDLGVYWLGGAP